jgi:hypothetical protein
MNVSKLIKVVVQFVQTWTWTFRFSWLWSSVVGLPVPYISKDHSATVLGVKQFKTIYLGLLDPLRWRHSDPSFEMSETTNPKLFTHCHIPDNWIITTLLSEPQVSCIWACFWSHCDILSFMILWLVTLHSWVCCYHLADGWCAGSSCCVG